MPEDESTTFESIPVYTKVQVCCVLSNDYQCTSGIQNRSGPDIITMYANNVHGVLGVQGTQFFP